MQEAARHEAGHAVAYWSHGWHFRYVTMRPRAENVIADVRMYRRRVSDTPVKLVTSMECAAAGRIAQFPVSSDAASDQLLRMEFTRVAGPPFVESYEDVDMREFVRCGLTLDWHDVRLNGPDGWLEIWHNAESKIRGDLWPAVMAVTSQLTISPRRLSYEDVSAIASAALPPVSSGATGPTWTTLQHHRMSHRKVRFAGSHNHRNRTKRVEAAVRPHVLILS